jgi:O-antigen/teichoic acid export membrane protein
LLLNYLGAEKYGIWITISSWAAFFGFFEFGIGKSLLNAISTAIGMSDEGMARRNISSAIIFLSLVAVLLWSGFLLVFRSIPWAILFSSVSVEIINQILPSIILIIFMFLMNLPLGLIQRIQVGYQESYINSYWWMLGSILGFIGIIIVTKIGGGIFGIVFVTFGSLVFSNGLNWIEFFGFRHRQLLPKLSFFDKCLTISLLKYGLLFFILEISASIGFQTDNIIIAKFIGAEQVTNYSIPAKLFTIVPLFLGLFLNPFWAAYGESLSQQDFNWIKKAFGRSLLLSFFISLFLSTFLIIFGGKIVNIWVGPTVYVSEMLIIMLGVWNIVMSISGPISVFLNAHKVIGFQIVTACLMGISNLIISIRLVGSVGSIGVVLGSTISVLLFIILPSLVYIRKIFRNYPTTS